MRVQRELIPQVVERRAQRVLQEHSPTMVLLNAHLAPAEPTVVEQEPYLV